VTQCPRSLTSKPSFSLYHLEAFFASQTRTAVDLMSLIIGAGLALSV
jgi:hypothetical protein